MFNILQAAIVKESLARINVLESILAKALEEKGIFNHSLNFSFDLFYEVLRSCKTLTSIYYTS